MTHEPQSKAGARSLRERARSGLRDVSWELKRWSYVDLGGGPEDTVFIAGCGRSGTTWIEELVNRNHDHRVIFEPFWSRHVPQLRGFTDYLYLRSGDDDPMYVQPVERILSGRVRNRWMDHHNTVRVAHKRLVKEIRANNWLGWAADLWPQMPMVFVMRHPIAVASSGTSLGWDDGLDRILAQERLLEDHFDQTAQSYLRSLQDPWERTIARLCVENMVPFRTLGPGRATLVLYEQLASHSEDEAERLLTAVGQSRDAAFDMAIDQPSRLSRPGGSMGASTSAVEAWQAKVDRAQLTRACDVIERLGFGDVYGDSVAPNVDAAHLLWAQAKPRTTV